MWHSVGLTLLVFVATLLIVLLLMVCGQRIPSGAIRRAACDHEVATVFKSWQALIPQLSLTKRRKPKKENTTGRRQVDTRRSFALVAQAGVQ
ncbi:small integral membrane protein 13 isoform X1 [Saimiri boliviensis]|uniref:small integral membrane protein 13 isoform X1 n=1 Tax=Saimiri boliviensis TaxID=27679 RepID=UPI003D786103